MASVIYGDFLYGLRDIKITNLAGTVQEDLGAGQSLDFAPTYTSADQTGDDAVVASISRLVGGTATVTAGRLSTAALALMWGKTVTVTSSSPTEVATLQFNAGDSPGYFKMYAQAWDDKLGDIHVIFSKCKITGGGDISLAYETFSNYGFEVKILDDGTNGVYKIIQHETRTNLPTS